MIDAVIRMCSFLVYVFLLNFFFASWSVSERRSLIWMMTLAGLAGIVAVSSYAVPSSVEPFINLVVTLIAMTTIALHHEVAIKDMLFWFIILLAINFISEALSLAVFRSITAASYGPQSFIFAIATTSISMMLEVLMIFGLKLVVFRNQMYLESLKLPVLLALTSIPLVSIGVLFSFLMANINTSVHSPYFVLMITVGVLYMNLCGLYLYGSLTKHLRKINQITLQNKSLSFERKYLTELKKSQNQLAAMRHDLKNQYIVLLGLLEKKRVGDAKRYLSKSTDRLNMQQKFYTRDVVLNYLLNDKRDLADKAGIRFDIKVLLAEQINVDNDVLAILIGNLLDNALEASRRLGDSRSAKITLVIKQFDNKLLIDIENIFDPAEAMTRQRRKIEGLGTSNVKRLIARHNGLYRQWMEENKFFVSVILLDIVKKTVGEI
ncbi:GHKL domain-containing protein [Lacticaseibacillus zeae]|uniref:GHKL domain-containing protein n=2 Tax=Lacticaseibacillus zeae TaxID=57037 RepID=A0ABD7Z8U6_LACZE|nr:MULTISPECIES: GHKL domain-containing protein [Lacticaseibacillus]MDE3316782.1 GHKL domain-containing protein [Lacticaseibacillus zeae]OFR95947.1 histidine kinase [Lactobacillus sp. HMSC068F07]WLV83574.1 GHKL domain-containing protein [Lacticaseibacillus sp. NCIMB 15475]WLV86323.1 GHKL domain-containing protein [Lacticaseibacillus sp. NCIMB 15474]